MSTQKFTSKNISISEIEVNKGQIYGLPKNPRFIRDERFKALKKSIEDAPEMLGLRELLVYPYEGKYVVIGGNMRFRACKELGYKEIPCKVLPVETPVEKLREYSIKDNEAFGQNDWDILANEWDTEELQGWGMELPFDWSNDDSANDSNDVVSGEGNQKRPTNSELDLSDADDKVKIVFLFDIEEWQAVNARLQKIDANKENALLKLIGYGEE